MKVALLGFALLFLAPLTWAEDPPACVVRSVGILQLTNWKRLWMQLHWDDRFGPFVLLTSEEVGAGAGLARTWIPNPQKTEAELKKAVEFKEFWTTSQQYPITPAPSSDWEPAYPKITACNTPAGPYILLELDPSGMVHKPGVGESETVVKVVMTLAQARKLAAFFGAAREEGQRLERFRKDSCWQQPRNNLAPLGVLS